MQQQQVKIEAATNTLSAATPELKPLQKIELIPGVLDIQHSLNEVDSNDDDETIDVEDVFESTHHSGYRPTELSVVTEKYIIAGALIPDEDAQNPMEMGDGQGSIFHYGRRGGRGEEREFYEDLDFDGNGNKDLENGCVLEHLGSLIFDRVKKTKGAIQSLGWIIRKHQGKDAPQNADAIHNAIIDACANGAGMSDFIEAFTGQPSRNVDIDEVSSDALDNVFYWVDVLMEDAWEAAKDAGDVGNPLAIKLDIYEHSGVSYSISGEGMQCRWDTSRCAAVWVPDACAEENILTNALRKLEVGEVRWFGSLAATGSTLNAGFSIDNGITWVKGFNSWSQCLQALQDASHEKIPKEALLRTMQECAEDYARGVIKEYSAWCNGDVYGVCTTVINRETGEVTQEDACWGFIGWNYAETELHGNMLHLAQQFAQPQ